MREYVVIGGGIVMVALLFLSYILAVRSARLGYRGEREIRQGNSEEGKRLLVGAIKLETWRRCAFLSAFVLACILAVIVFVNVITP